MANTFKNAALANVTNSSYVDLYTCPASTQTVVLGLAIANKTTNAVTVQVQFQDTSASNADFQLLENVSIPANTTLETLAGQKYILDNRRHPQSSSRHCVCSIDVVMGLMEKA